MTDLGDQAALPLPGEGEDPLVEGNEYATAYGETLAETLNLDSWEAGFDLGALYGRVEAEIGPAIEQERRIQDTVRRELFPLLRLPAIPDTDSGRKRTSQGLAVPVIIFSCHVARLSAGPHDKSTTCLAALPELSSLLVCATPSEDRWARQRRARRVSRPTGTGRGQV